MILESSYHFVNYELNSFSQAVNKIATNPSAVEKVFYFAIKVFEFSDLSSGRAIQQRPVTDAMRGTINYIEFYDTFKKIFFWINPFSKESIDHEVLSKSLCTAISGLDEIINFGIFQKPEFLSQTESKEGKEKTLEEKVFDEVMDKKAYNSKQEVLEAVRTSLVGKGFTLEKAQEITSHVIVQQKSRPLVQILTKACFTVTGIGSNLATLKKWDLLDLSQFALQMGEKSPLFLSIYNLGMSPVMRVAGRTGLVLSAGNTSYQLIMQGIKYSRIYREGKAEKNEKTYQELKSTFCDFLILSAEFTATFAPLAFTLNPPTVVFLGLFAKGIGLTFILAR